MADPAAIAQFTSVTGADQPTAEFFLSASQGNIDAAVSSFFESGGIVPSGREAPRPRASRPAPTPQPPRAADRPARASNPSGVATLGSLGGQPEEDDDEREGYYAGGEKSGQMIQDPRKRDEAGPSNVVDAIIQRAQDRGPRTEAEREEFEGPQRFAGAGYRLGDQAAPSNAARPDVVGTRNVTRVLTFYANGFTVDEGPLRSFQDPANAGFLNDVNRGAVPREMEEAGVSGVSITLVDKKNEEYKEQKPRIVPFSGGGQRLDSGAGERSNAVVESGVDTEGAAAAVRVDESRPIASVQVRLSDGTRVVARLNEDNTVGDLREFVRASRRSVGVFVLSTTFPRKQLDDDSKTIKEAGLKGAVVVQTLK